MNAKLFVFLGVLALACAAVSLGCHDDGYSSYGYGFGPYGGYGYYDYNSHPTSNPYGYYDPYGYYYGPFYDDHNGVYFYYDPYYDEYFYYDEYYGSYFYYEYYDDNEHVTIYW
ncbi:MAG: hypothetical protein E3J72_08325 [Planctomycetota bacterium]|nr:MAG: hypothetical protein E3J72_08325 [Planctomycetota bacterium]